MDCHELRCNSRNDDKQSTMQNLTIITQRDSKAQKRGRSESYFTLPFPIVESYLFGR
ncbi:hypothetical protein [Helicobacter sp. MIT 05-5294]|uniref:hypothetical protein n=1 Tax=Helicobacter sp. MIT 05-5294 TaxID=1548150 RepID=UPI000A43EAD6|nr:hypothetical protein [Helicobacter sp. MIT 05-5294]